MTRSPASPQIAELSLVNVVSNDSSSEATLLSPGRVARPDSRIFSSKGVCKQPATMVVQVSSSSEPLAKAPLFEPRAELRANASEPILVWARLSFRLLTSFSGSDRIEIKCGRLSGSSVSAKVSFASGGERVSQSLDSIWGQRHGFWDSSSS